MVKPVTQLLQLSETHSPFAVSVFNDQVYWSDTKRRTIQTAHKRTGKNRRVLLKRPGQPFGLKASLDSGGRNRSLVPQSTVRALLTGLL